MLPAADSAEYKQVTVLFADVVHSMDIAAAVGTERLREIMAELVDLASLAVQRCGGTMDKFTGDGIMAVFGAPIALEDHAVRACRAAVDLQRGMDRLTREVNRRDAVELVLRVGLNSGQVIAGEVGSRSLGYTTIGEQVGMAQRMESIAPPGEVMLSASTARLVHGAAQLGEPEFVRIKGVSEPVPAQLLLSMRSAQTAAGRAESSLVGRQWEKAAIEGLLERAIGGHGAVVGVVGSAGIGKSRLVRELVAMARCRDVDVLSTFCESHTSQVPFRAVSRLLRSVTGVEELDAAAAREQVHARFPDAEPEDLALFDDLLGIADNEVALPRIDPDARRRRLTAFVNAASLARETSAIYIVEDVHWIDDVSESMLADFVAITPQTPSLVLFTYRPEYQGALQRLPGTQTIALGPLTDGETEALTAELLGPHRSTEKFRQAISGRAAGNPFFAEEIVRDLAERGALRGRDGAYVATTDNNKISVPATLQAAIAARIDRLEPNAKRTLSAAAVAGSRFTSELLSGLVGDPALDDLLRAEMIEQVRFTPHNEYAFRHPLIRTVAYESQLKSARTKVHRQLAETIQERHRGAVDEHAALIAEHAEAAGDLPGAYEWHMRAGAWSANRNIAAARLGWERARLIADSLPEGGHDRSAMRIAPRTLLCGSGWRGDYPETSRRFKELRELCALAGDKSSLAIGMTGLLGDHYRHGRLPDASRYANEQMALIDSISDPTLNVMLSGIACVIKRETAHLGDVLRWSDQVIQNAGGDPTAGNTFVGSPLGIAFAQRGLARWALGRPGSLDDFDRAVAISRAADPVSYAMVINTKYTPAIAAGVLVADDAALTEIHEALRVSERSSDDVALGLTRTTLGVALVHRESPDERARGLDVLERLCDMCTDERYYLSVLHFGQVFIALEKARLGDSEGALKLLRSSTDHMRRVGHLLAFAPATGILVRVLLDRGDVSGAAEAIDRLASAPFDPEFRPLDVWLLRLRALLAQAHGDQSNYRDYRQRYHAMATALDYRGHIKWAQALP